MNRYRKKPVEVEAIQFIESLYRKDSSRYKRFPIVDRAMMSELWLSEGSSSGRYYISTLEGDMIVSEGDYIIKGIKGEFYPCKPDVFEMTYERIND